MNSELAKQVSKKSSRRPKSSLLLPDIDALRARTGEDGDLAREGAILRHTVAARMPGHTDLRQFHAMLWPSSSDDWTQWLQDLAQVREITHTACLMMDPWISGSMTLRLALHAAWAADSGSLSKEALRRTQETAVNVCDQYVWPMFKGRAVDRAVQGRGIELSNQVAAMLAGMLFVGHVFGHRLTRNKDARELYVRARDAFPLVIGALDNEGYQGEGPIYQVNVEAPALILGAELLDETEGGDHYNEQYDHPQNGRQKGCLRRFVETSVAYLYSSSGLCLPLDDYGPARPSSAFPLAYAARRSGNRKFLDMLTTRGPFAVGRFMWLADDLALRMIHWPLETRGKPWRGTGSFVLPKHFGMLADESGSRLLQLWDHCEPLPHTHAHVNPNSVTVEAFGIPVLIEGSKRSEHVPFSTEPGMRSAPLHSDPFGDIFRFGPGDYRDAGALAIGSHNCILVDGQDIVRPKWDASGKLIRFTDGPVASLVESDSTPIYEASGVALLAATRVSMLDRRQGLFVVGDEMVSRKSRTFAWQAHLRGRCTEVPGGIVAETREGVGLEIACADGNPFELQHMPSYPAIFEGESTRLRRHVRGKSVRFLHLLRPLRLRPIIADLTDGWRAALGELLGPEDGMPDANAVEHWSATLREPAFVEKPHALGRWVTYKKNIKLAKELQGARIFLHLPVPAGRADGVPRTDVHALWVNGEAFDVAPAAETAFRLLDSVVDITRAVRFGAVNSLRLQVMSSTDGGTRGRALLTASFPKARHVSTRITQTRRGMRIRTEAGVCMYNSFGAPCAGTDATRGLIGTIGAGRGKTYGALFDCTRVLLDGLGLVSDVRMSIQWDERTLWLSLPKSGCTVRAGSRTVVERSKRRQKRLGTREIRIVCR